MKVIQLRGANACGKSTTCRQFIERGNFNVKYIEIKGKQYPYMYDENRRIAVTGKYGHRTTDGLDGVVRNKDVLLDYVAKILNREKPEYLVFEGLLYGITFSFGQQLYRLSRACGYEFIGILLHLPFEEQHKRLCERNGGADASIDGLLSKYNSSHISTDKMRKSGITIKVVNVMDYKQTDMYKIVEAEIE